MKMKVDFCFNDFFVLSDTLQGVVINVRLQLRMLKNIRPVADTKFKIIIIKHFFIYTTKINILSAINGYGRSHRCANPSSKSDWPLSFFTCYYVWNRPLAADPSC